MKTVKIEMTIEDWSEIASKASLKEQYEKWWSDSRDLIKKLEDEIVGLKKQIEKHKPLFFNYIAKDCAEEIRKVD